LLRTLLLSGTSTLLVRRCRREVVVEATLIVAVTVIIMGKVLDRRELLVEPVRVIRSCTGGGCSSSILTVRAKASESRIKVVLTTARLFASSAAEWVGAVIVPVRTTQAALTSLVLLKRRGCLSWEGSRDILSNTS
jgi:hypothetical protein